MTFLGSQIDRCYVVLHLRICTKKIEQIIEMFNTKKNYEQKSLYLLRKKHFHRSLWWWLWLCEDNNYNDDDGNNHDQKERKKERFQSVHNGIIGNWQCRHYQTPDDKSLTLITNKEKKIFSLIQLIERTNENWQSLSRQKSNLR